jgi:hypothetical protein
MISPARGTFALNIIGSAFLWQGSSTAAEYFRRGISTVKALFQDTCFPLSMGWRLGVSDR